MASDFMVTQSGKLPPSISTPLFNVCPVHSLQAISVILMCAHSLGYVYDPMARFIRPYTMNTLSSCQQGLAKDEGSSIMRKYHRA